MKKNGIFPHSLNIFFPFSTKRNTKGWRKVLNILLRKVGLTWRFSPIRRVIQLLFLGLFFFLFFHVAWPYAKVFSESAISDKEWLPVEFFLWLDPLAGIASSIAARHLSVALLGTGAVFLICLLFPRGFCGYICPLGTIIDGFDWLIGKRLAQFHVKKAGWWQYLRYFVLIFVLIAAVGGVMLAGFVAAIPILTRGLLFTGGRLQLGLAKDWSLVEPAGWTLYLSLGLFSIVLLLGILRRRFWCSYICPTGALFSLYSIFRINERKVEASCINCGKCMQFCPFYAINEDFTTRALNCTFCQTCGGACPTHSIKFVSRWNSYDLKIVEESSTSIHNISRRGFVFSAIIGAAASASIRTGLADSFRTKPKLLRPPGSVPESQFLDLCVRCGECIRACPGPVLHPAGLEGGLDAIWTPKAIPVRSGCHQDCNFCTQVCPTGAIRPLSIDEKRKTHMGLATINTELCLPHTGERDCRLCFMECEAAGYNAIQMRQIELDVGDIPPGDMPGFGFDSVTARIEMSRIEAPFIDPDACVGCGLCEYRCHKSYVKREKIFPRSAIAVVPENRGK